MRQRILLFLLFGFGFETGESVPTTESGPSDAHASIRGAMMSDSGGAGDGMHSGHGWTEDDSDGNMMGGGGHMDAMSVIMELLTSADEQLIDRVVQPLYQQDTAEQVGVETFTTSSDPSVASNIQLHVMQMQALLKLAQDGQGGNIRHWDPLFAALHDAADEIELEMAPLENGVHAWHGGTTRCAAALVQAHADAVSKFASNGHDEAMVSHPVPEVCTEFSGQQDNGFVSFKEFGADSSEWVNVSTSLYEDLDSGHGMWDTNNGSGMHGDGDHMGWNCENGTRCNHTWDGEWWNCTAGSSCMNHTMDDGWNCSPGMLCENRTSDGTWNCSSGSHCGNRSFDADNPCCQDGNHQPSWNCSHDGLCGNSSSNSTVNGNLLSQQTSSASAVAWSPWLLCIFTSYLFLVGSTLREL